MKSLAERHQDRAQRKLENSLDSNYTTDVSGKISNAGYLMEQAQVAYAGLSETERAKLMDTYQGADPVDGFRSLAEDDQGNYKYAGIGVVNPLVVPPADYPAPVSLSEITARAGNGGGAGNTAGRVVEAALSSATNPISEPAATGWGTPVPMPEESPKGEPEQPEVAELPAINAKMTVADLEKIATDEGVDLSEATNNDMRVAAIQAKRDAGKPN